MVSLSRKYILTLTGFLLLLIAFFPKLSFAQECTVEDKCSKSYTTVGSCQACTGMNGTFYVYTRHTCDGGEKPIGTNYCQAARPTSAVESALPLNSNVQGCFLDASGWSGGGDGSCLPIPAGCNLGFNTGGCDNNLPTFGQPPECPGGGPVAGDCNPLNHVCCQAFDAGDCCSQVSAECQPVMGCPSSSTPTPSPFCRLFCPGQEDLIGQLDQNGSGVSNNNFQPTPILPTQAVGFLQFYGYNNFVCSTFDDAKTYVKACPVDTSGGIGGKSSWMYPTPTTNPLRYNMLCGGQPHNYTAVVTAEGRSKSYGGGVGGEGGTPTLGPTPTSGLYPPGCILEDPTPTPPGGTPSAGDLSAGSAKDQGGSLSSSSSSCSCSVQVGCQAALELPPSQTGSVSCNPTCDFTVNPDNPVYNESVNFSLSGNASSISFDDNSATVNDPSSTTAHTFANAGVYNVALSCDEGAQLCSRSVNVYCSYIPKLWYKLKDTSLTKRGELKNPLPTQIIAYDGDDTTQRYQIISQAGIITTDGSLNIGADPASTRDWKRASYTTQTRVSPSTYLEYVKSRKSYVTVSASGIITGNDLTASKINVATGDYTLDSASIQSKAPFVLVVNGNATITGNINPPAKSLAVIVTGTLNITSAVSELNGIFIASSIDLASDITSGNTTNTTLKIVGNIISQSAVDINKRKGDNIQKPSLFVMGKPEMYIDLMPMLSVRQYEWTQLSP